jgi:hypothetical protein
MRATIGDICASNSRRATCAVCGARGTGKTFIGASFIDPKDPKERRGRRPAAAFMAIARGGRALGLLKKLYSEKKWGADAFMAVPLDGLPVHKTCSKS